MHTPRDGGVDGVLDIGFPSHITVDIGDGSFQAELLAEGQTEGVLDVGDDNLGTVSDENPRRALSEASRTSGDDRHLVL